MTRIVAMLIVLPLARIFLGESITILKVLGVVVGSIGLLLVCKPDIFYKSEPGDFPFLENNQTIVQNSSLAFNTSSVNYETQKSEIIGYICAALTALNSVVHILFRDLGFSMLLYLHCVFGWHHVQLQLVPFLLQFSRL